MEPKQTIYILGSPSHLLPQDLRLGALLPRHECTACRKHCKQVTEMRPIRDAFAAFPLEDAALADAD
jgi:hypothetical protein